MWIYESAAAKAEPIQAASPAQKAMSPALSFSDGSPAVQNGIFALPAERRQASGEKAAGTGERQRSSNRLYFSACFLGLFAAGIIRNFCGENTAEYLRYYENNWLSLLQSASILQRFGSLFLAGMLALTIMLFWGMCAAGPFLLLPSLMGKGICSGILIGELFQVNGWKGFVYGGLLLLFDSILALLMCRIAGPAAQAARRIGRNDSTGLRRRTGQAPSVWSVYFFSCAVLIPVCGLIGVLSGPYDTLLRSFIGQLT